MNFYHDHKRNLLVYETPSPLHVAQLMQSIPAARQVNGAHVAVPITLQNSQILRYLQYPVTPIVTDANYDFPIEPGRVPKEHQKAMCNFSILHPRSFNLSDPGTMKTLPALWAADWLMRQNPGWRALIIAPLNVIENVWPQAVFSNFLERRSFEVLHGDAEKRRALLAKKPDFSLINVDGMSIGAHVRRSTRQRLELDGLSRDLAEDKAIKIIIVDEADAYCDAQTKRHLATRLAIGDRPYLWLLTGTPTGQTPTDAYGLGKLVNNAHGKSFRDFRAATMIQVSNFKWIPRKDGNETAFRLLTPAIRYDIKDVWKNAPPCVTKQVAVPLTADQIRHLGELKRSLQITMRSGKTITAQNEAGARLKLLQISLGMIYDSVHKAHAIDAAPRYKEVEKIINSTQRKVLIFSPLTSIVDFLFTTLSKKWKCGVINGEVSLKDRKAAIDVFVAKPEYKIMILDPQSVSHGINDFVVADTVIWIAPIDKTRLYIQGNKRVHRPGQGHPVTIWQVVSNKTEIGMFERLESNTSMQGLLLDMVRRGEI
jgi:hypothetical protein